MLLHICTLCNISDLQMLFCNWTWLQKALCCNCSFCHGEGVGKGLVVCFPLLENCQSKFDSWMKSVLKLWFSGSPVAHLEEDRAILRSQQGGLLRPSLSWPRLLFPCTGVSLVTCLSLKDEEPGKHLSLLIWDLRTVIFTCWFFFQTVRHTFSGVCRRSVMAALSLHPERGIFFCEILKEVGLLLRFYV